MNESNLTAPPPNHTIRKGPESKPAVPSFTSTVDILTRETVTQRALYVAHVLTAFKARLKHLTSALESCGMDLDRYAPPAYTLKNCSRREYSMARAKRSHAEQYFGMTAETQAALAACRTVFSRPPYIVALHPGAHAKLATLAAREADIAFDGYIVKLAGKIEATLPEETKAINSPVPVRVRSVVLNGAAVWEGSVLDVTLSSGARQGWHTKCILNVSVLGKLFNQWPTRRLDWSTGTIKS